MEIKHVKIVVIFLLSLCLIVDMVSTSEKINDVKLTSDSHVEHLQKRALTLQEILFSENVKRRNSNGSLRKILKRDSTNGFAWSDGEKDKAAQEENHGAKQDAFGYGWTNE